jgi:hypothetical protein
MYVVHSGIIILFGTKSWMNERVWQSIPRARRAISVKCCILLVLCDHKNGTYNVYRKKWLVDGPSRKPSKTMKSHYFTTFTRKYGDRRDLVFPDAVDGDSLEIPPPVPSHLDSGVRAVDGNISDGELLVSNVETDVSTVNNEIAHKTTAEDPI